MIIILSGAPFVFFIYLTTSLIGTLISLFFWSHCRRCFFVFFFYFWGRVRYSETLGSRWPRVASVVVSDMLLRLRPAQEICGGDDTVLSRPPSTTPPSSILTHHLSLSPSLFPFDVLLNEATPISSCDRVRLPLHTFRRRRGRENSPCVMYSRGVEWLWSATERYLVDLVGADVLVPNLCSRALRQQRLLQEGRAAFFLKNPGNDGHWHPTSFRLQNLAWLTPFCNHQQLKGQSAFLFWWCIRGRNLSQTLTFKIMFIWNNTYKLFVSRLNKLE